MNAAARLGLNVLLLKIGWVACVLSAAKGAALAGTATVVVIAAIHLRLAHKPAAELKLLVAAGLIGLTWDSLLVALGWASYPAGTFLTGLAPHWIVAMWVLFATTLNVSLVWMKARPWLAAAVGGIGGPLSFYAGSKLGGVVFPDLILGLGAQAVGWAILMPLLMWLAARFDGASTHARDALVVATEGVAQDV